MCFVCSGRLGNFSFRMISLMSPTQPQPMQWVAMGQRHHHTVLYQHLLSCKSLCVRIISLFVCYSVRTDTTELMTNTETFILHDFWGHKFKNSVGGGLLFSEASLGMWMAPVSVSSRAFPCLYH